MPKINPFVMTVPAVMAATQLAKAEEASPISEQTRQYRQKLAHKALHDPHSLAQALSDKTKIKACDTGLFPS